MRLLADLQNDLAVIEALYHLNPNGERLLQRLARDPVAAPFVDKTQEVGWWLLNNHWDCGHPVFWVAPDAIDCSCRERLW